ncbi:hypothetical protein IFR05_007650 [Cadophora sp. M221]|nr:hypothetical protein IFR05_007650 [Cadophora sp. M221]
MLNFCKSCRSSVDIEELVKAAGLAEELQEKFDALKLETETAHRKIESLQIEAEVNSAENARNMADFKQQMREDDEATEKIAVQKKNEWYADILIRDQIVGVDGILRYGEEKRRHPLHVKDVLEIIQRVCKNTKYVDVYATESNENLEFEEYRGPEDWDAAVLELEHRLKIGYPTSYEYLFVAVRDALAKSRDRVFILIWSHPIYCSSLKLVRDKIQQQAIDYFDRRLTQEMHRFASKIWDRDLSKVLRIGDSHVNLRSSKTLDFGPWKRTEMFELAQQTWEQIRGADAR